MSTQHKHTAAPWVFTINGTINTADRKHCIASCHTANDDYAANAALIAESPALLKCLEDVMQDLFGRLNHGVSMEHMQAAAAAIAKANGERP